MTRGDLAALVALLVVTTLTTSCGTVHDPNACSLEGIVLDRSTGAPVADVTVALGVINTRPNLEKPVVPYGDGDRPYTQTTGRDGKFRFGGLKAGKLLLMIQDESMGCVEGEVSVGLAAGDNKQDIELHVAEGASISGTIYNDGYYHGVGGVTVQVVPSHEQRKEWVRAYEAVTNRDGTFSIGGIPSGNYDIRSSPTDGLQQTSVLFHGETPVCVPGNPFGFPMEWGTRYEPFEFTVEPGALARGVVVDEAGAPVAGAGIFHFGRDITDPADVLTDGNGQFLYPNDEELMVPSIIAYKDGCFSEWLNSDRTLDKYGPICLTLHPGSSLRVRVVDSEGQPIGWPFDIDISVEYQGAPSSPYARAMESEPGLFVLPRLPAAKYKLGVWGTHSKYIDSLPESIALSPGDDREITLVARNTQELRGPDILGRVVDSEGNPIPVAKLEGIANDSYRATTSSDGSFSYRTRSIKALGAYEKAETLDRLNIRISAAGFMNQVISARPGDDYLEIVLEKAVTFHGRVLDASTENAIELFQATTYCDSRRGRSERRYWKKMDGVEVTRKADGDFEISGITMYPCIVEVEAAGFAKNHVEVKTNPEESAPPVEFRLSPTSHLGGVLVDARGIPIRNANIFASLTRKFEVFPDPAENQTSSILSSYTTSDESGAFYLPFESIGQVSIKVISPYPEHRHVIDVPAGGIDGLRIVVPDGATIQGQVTLGGIPFSGAVVSSNEGIFETDTRRRFTLVDQPLGRMDVTFSIPQRDAQPFLRWKSISVEVKPGLNNDIIVDFLPGTASLECRLSGARMAEGGSATILIPLPDGEQIMAQVPIDGEGNFHVLALPAYDAWVTIRQERLKHVSSVRLQPDRTEQLTILLDSLANVRGRLVRGAHQGSIRIVAIPGEPQFVEAPMQDLSLSLRTVATAHVDEDEFTLKDIPIGRVTVLCLADSAGKPSTAPLVVLGRKTIDVVPVGVSGVVLELDSPK